MKERHEKLLSYYHALHHRRREWFDWRIRLAAMIIGLAVLGAVYTFFNARYSCAVIDGRGSIIFVSDLVFNIFIAGSLFGMVLFAFITEGEYLLGMRKTVYSIIESEEAGAMRKPQQKARTAQLAKRRL